MPVEMAVNYYELFQITRLGPVLGEWDGDTVN